MIKKKINDHLHPLSNKSLGDLSANIKKPIYINHIIKILVGPEILTGSTRMKAGTATKMVLNMISTTTMVKLNKVFKNYMVERFSS